MKFVRAMISGLVVATVVVGLSRYAISQAAESSQPTEPAPQTTSQPADEEAAKSEPPTAEQIDRWISELDDNLFDNRENAQENLSEAGMAALDKIAKEASSGSLESSTRALNILLAWSEQTKRHKLRIAALKKIIGLEDHPQESLLAGELLANAKELAALTKILELGAHCTIDTQNRIPVLQLPGGNVRPLQITIDKDWTGGVAGLSPLRDLRRVITLSFHSAKLGDEVATILLDLPQLRRIELYGMNISDEVVEQLEARLPQRTTLEVRGGAKLGIRGNEHPKAIVMEVVPGTAAENAGLKKGDHITHIDGKAVKNFRELTQRIARHRANDSVVLKVKRQLGRGPKLKEMELKVTFDQWGADTTALGQPSVERGQDPSRVLTPLRINLDRR